MSKIIDDAMIRMGNNLKHERTSRGYTLSQLSDLIFQTYGEMISESMISQWESGKKRMYADQLAIICHSLNISPYRIYGDFEQNTEELLFDVVKVLPNDEKSIYKYMYTHWDGNPRALTKFLGLYMSMPRKYRLDVAGMGLTMYKLCSDVGLVDQKAPSVDIEYIDDAWEDLMKHS